MEKYARENQKLEQEQMKFQMKKKEKVIESLIQQENENLKKKYTEDRKFEKEDRKYQGGKKVKNSFM
jgi:hypothetical protein